ncbi:hypothetical protein F4780DRAFT_784795 [Xylariomycetidae sp. FL0641]|nr:hypothetical protein F4780DRAFT_784795 [Xylariomycetidae sp. FL0641]
MVSQALEPLIVLALATSSLALSGMIPDSGKSSTTLVTAPQALRKRNSYIDPFREKGGAYDHDHDIDDADASEVSGEDGREQ